MEQFAARELHAAVKGGIDPFPGNLIKTKTGISGRNRLEKLPTAVAGTAV
jgi:hypothetical protein